MRWSIVLECPSAAVGSVLTLGPDRDRRSATVRIAAEGDEVVFRAEAVGAASPRRPAYPEWHHRDHLVVMLDPAHGHEFYHGLDTQMVRRPDLGWMDYPERANPPR